MGLFSGRVDGSVRPALEVAALFLATGLLVALLAVVPFERVRYWSIDLGTYRAAALALRDGANPYLPENLRTHADGAPISAITGYTYPPLFLLFILPLTWLPLQLAVRAWLLLNLCMLAGSVLLLFKALAWNLTARRFLVLMLGVSAFMPVLFCLAFGQASIFVLFWLAATFYLIKRGRDVCAGVCLALCFTKLQVLAWVPLVFLIQKRWRLVGSWALAFFLSVLPFWRLWPSWLETILWTTEANMAYLGYYCQPCLSALAKVLFTTRLPRTLFAGIATLSVLAGVAWLGASRGKNRDSPAFDRVFALAVAASLLTAGYIRTYDLVLLLVPLSILMNDARRADVPLPSRRILRASVALAYLFPYVFLALSPLALVLRSGIFHITSILSVMIGLLASILTPSRRFDGPLVRWYNDL